MLHYEKGTLQKTFFGGVISIFGSFIIGYFAIDKALAMIANHEAITSSVIGLYHDDDTEVDLLDMNMVKVMVEVTNQNYSNSLNMLEPYVPLDLNSRKYIHVNIVHV